MGKQCWPDEGGRAWLEVTLIGPPNSRGRQTQVTQRLVADLGCMFSLILDERTLRRVRWGDRPGEMSNYGWLVGAAVQVVMPELELDEKLVGYGQNRVARLVREEGFDGLAGKPLLDLFHWSNGEGGEFCLESWTQFRTRRGSGQGKAPPTAE